MSTLIVYAVFLIFSTMEFYAFNSLTVVKFVASCTAQSDIDPVHDTDLTMETMTFIFETDLCVPPIFIFMWA